MRLSCLLFSVTWLVALSCFAQDAKKTLQKPANEQPADALKWQNQVKQVLDFIGDEKSSPNRRDASYESLMALQPSATEPPQLQMAFAIVAVSQKRYGDTLKLTNQILSQNPNYTPARALHARLLLITHKYAQAVVELESVIDAIIAADGSSSIPQMEHAARLVGLATGYFTGPGNSVIRPTVLAELNAAGKRIPEPMKTAYDSARLAMEEEYRVLTEQGEEALKEHRAKLEKEASELRQQLEEQRAKAASESEYAKTELQTNFSRLNNQWQTAWNAAQQLGQRGDALLRQELSLRVTLGAIRPPMRDSQGRVDPYDSQRYMTELNSVQAALANVGYNIVAVSNQYENALNHGMLIERQMQALQTRAQQLGMNLAMQNESFNRLDAAIRKKQADATKAEPKKKSGAQIRQERAFITYDDLNAHKEKKLLLDAIEKIE
jgi:hypothetical protein